MEWKISPSFPSYKISERGDVCRIVHAKGCRPNPNLKPYRRADGYNMFILRRDGKSFHKKAHQLVAEAFLGPKPFEAAEVCHFDGCRQNDHWSNLRWDTRAGNHADKRRHGTSFLGEAGPNAKFTEEQVRLMARMYEGGCSQQAIGEHFGVKQGHVGRILRGDRWSHMGLDVTSRSRGCKAYAMPSDFVDG